MADCALLYGLGRWEVDVYKRQGQNRSHETGRKAGQEEVEQVRAQQVEPVPRRGPLVAQAGVEVVPPVLQGQQEGKARQHQQMGQYLSLIHI